MNDNSRIALDDMTEYIRELEDLLWATSNRNVKPLDAKMFEKYREVMDRIETRKNKEK